MPRSTVAISLDQDTLERLDRLVREAVFANRSQAIQKAVEEKLERVERGRLARECAKLDRVQEQALAEEGLFGELPAWPEYGGARSGGQTSNPSGDPDTRDSVRS